MYNLIIVSGISSSGKTTYVEKYFTDYKILSQDQYMIDTYHDKNKPFEESDLQNFFTYISDNITDNVVIDFISSNINTRKQIFDVIKDKQNCNLKFIFLTISFNTQKERMIKRGSNCISDSEGLRRLESIYNSIIPPTLKELQQYGFNSVELEIKEND